MKRTKVFYNALILLATLLLTACQERKNTPPSSLFTREEPRSV